MRVFLAIFFALLPTILLAQIDTEATSNKSEYMYGEVMEVTLKITNTSDEPFSYRGPSTGLSYVKSFSGIDTSPRIWTLDEQRDTLCQGQSIEVTWQVVPELTSFPTFTGEQTIKMQIWGVTDSVKFMAERYIGGKVYVYFDRDIVDTTEAKYYADSLNVEISEDYDGYMPRHPGYFWDVDSMLVDSLISRLSNDDKVLESDVKGRYRIESINVIRTSVEDQKGERGQFSLSQNYPNPFNPETTIEFSLEQAGFVELTVFDLMGRRIKTLVESRMISGLHSVKLGSEELSSGTYIYRLKTSNGILTKRFTLIK